jgi:hypothetical protein
MCYALNQAGVPSEDKHIRPTPADAAADDDEADGTLVVP